MKKIITAACLGIMACIACSTSRQAAQTPAAVDKYGKEEQLSDSFLHKLQQENDLVLATYTESLAWGVHYNYTIAARKNNNWHGYLYTISGTRAKRQVQTTSVDVDVKKLDSAMALLTNPVLWRARDNSSTCNMHVDDGSTSYLLMASPSKVVKVSYYMPESYQKFCPDSTRQLFLNAFARVNGVVAGAGNEK